MSFIDPGPPRTVQHRKQNLFITGGSAAPPPPVGFQIFYGFNETPLAVASGAPLVERLAMLLRLSPLITNFGFEVVTYVSGTACPLFPNFDNSLGGVIAGTITGNGLIRTAPTQGRFNTTVPGAKYLEIPSTATGTFGISFDAPVAFFGFYVTDVGDFNGKLTITLNPSGGGAPVTYTVYDPPGGGVASGALVYWGFVDNVRTYDSFQLVGVGGALDFYGIDDLITGDAGFIIL